MSKDDKKVDQAKAQAAPMGPVAGLPGMGYTGFLDMNHSFPNMPGTQPDFALGCPSHNYLKSHLCHLHSSILIIVG